MLMPMREMSKLSDNKAGFEALRGVVNTRRSCDNTNFKWIEARSANPEVQTKDEMNFMSIKDTVQYSLAL